MSRRLPPLDQGLTAWLTGLPSAGKTTLARALEKRLLDQGHRVEVLDGDVVRTHLTRDLGYSRDDRDENIRRIGFVASLLARNGVVVLASVISPYRTTRDEVIPVHIQDRMIAEADQLTPANPFTVHTLAASHFAPITQPTQLADILAGLRAA